MKAATTTSALRNVLNERGWKVNAMSSTGFIGTFMGKLFMFTLILVEGEAVCEIKRYRAATAMDLLDAPHDASMRIPTMGRPDETVLPALLAFLDSTEAGVIVPAAVSLTTLEKSDDRQQG